MSREWKPGDVAMIRVGTGDWECGVRREDDTWGCRHTLNGFHDHDAQATPLVVIDPEDNKQVERFVRACPDEWAFTQDDDTVREVVGHMQAALREFANPTPPRPEEPTGLGAVVEDASGRRFVRYEQGADWNWLCGTASHRWSDLTAVRILSEGVRP